MLIVSNNPSVENVFKRIVYLKGRGYLEVLIKCRDLIYENYELLSHPLYGSVKPNETPYRSIIMKKGNKLDINSVTLIEEAIATANKFLENKMTPKWTDRILDDFEVIDFDIFSNTLNRIQYIV